jgi:hypothetical protein
MKIVGKPKNTQRKLKFFIILKILKIYTQKISITKKNHILAVFATRSLVSKGISKDTKEFTQVKSPILANIVTKSLLNQAMQGITKEFIQVKSHILAVIVAKHLLNLTVSRYMKEFIQVDWCPKIKILSLTLKNILWKLTALLT